ncbi:hypothetical protein H012_gp884 [Acanthamoeba polyphaga moumouvirus]|uniref:Uncharacterized protein n=1 Tax=Acanthamoeba polyphaga moumouvirus TaxID=1269028 RepID=L7RBN9_9VIRU|nr:hypothetical protein H012_gp884 [Acanthamoeba polyphaga moumouvirus]AGC01582.1 hypothetical protein Moumou_00034 [Acanthamoeba polyphaga moumouvirus]
MLNAFISQDPKNNFLHYLNDANNGTKYNLTNELITLEKKWNVPCSAIYIFTKMFDNKIWEIPTNELCEGLIHLFKDLQIQKINELAAGNGLLSARLKFFSEKLNYNLQITSSDGITKHFGNHKFTYTEVNDLNVYDYDKSEPIIISWIHNMFEKELLYCVKKYSQDYIFLVGQHPDKESYGSNHTYLFHEEILSYGYDYVILPFKQMSQVDYYHHDKIRTNIYNDSRTCVTLYYKLSKKSIVEKVIGSLKYNNSSLFGNYIRDNKKYYFQDKKLVKTSDENIDKYIKNNYHNLNPEYVFGLKNYVLQKIKQFIEDFPDEYKSLENSDKQSYLPTGLFRYNFNKNIFGSFSCATYTLPSTISIWDINVNNRISTKTIQANFHNYAY